MNERIRELHNRACRLDMEQHPDAFPSGERIQQKFAELIIAECLNQVREQYLPVLEDELMMKETYWVGYIQCGVDSFVAIREHFGVEE